MSAPFAPLGEAWRTVPGFEGYYEVSDQGRVRSVDRAITFEHPTHGTIRQRLKSKLLRPGRSAASGHLGVMLSREGRVTHHAVARLVLEGFVGPCPEGHQAKSLNDDPNDCRLANLAWQSIPVIRRRSIISGATPVGERHYRAKLRAADVLAIRAANGETHRALATRYGVSATRISAVRQGLTYKSVAAPPEHRGATE